MASPLCHRLFGANAVLNRLALNFFHAAEVHPTGACISVDATKVTVGYPQQFARACELASALHCRIAADQAQSRRVARPSASRHTGHGSQGCMEEGIRNIAILLPPGADFVTALTGTWCAGAAAVPLNAHATHGEMLHIVQDSGAAEIICGPEYIAAAQALARDVTGDRHVRVTVLAPETAEAQRGCITPRQRRSVAAVLSGSLGPAIAPEGDALIIYTSGTTSKPKGAVHSHSSVSNQCRVLLEAWRWTASDTILHTLPLHHVHGLINVLCCAIAAGARCEFFGAPSGKFDAAAVARRVAAGDVSLFMSVPPAYKKIEAAVRNWSASEQKAWRAACKAHVRLMVSGSSALPVPVLRSFEEVSGHRLLERYGMTEIGMALSQPLAVAARRPGTVGLPLPGVACRLAAPTADASEKDVAAGAELLIQSKSMFSRYWRQPSKTAEAFTRVPGEAGLWFLTGDNVAVDPATGAYTILGRASADIIKNSGYKISALEVENALMNTGLLEECAVLADPEAAASGSDSIVALVVVPAATAGRGSAVTKTEAAIRSALSESLSHYKRPREYIWLPAGIPRNAMGKVNKKALALQLATLRKSATR